MVRTKYNLNGPNHGTCAIAGFVTKKHINKYVCFGAVVKIVKVTTTPNTSR